MIDPNPYQPEDHCFLDLSWHVCYWEDPDEPPDEPEFDCGWYPEDGICLLAGTEDCDFECEFHDLHYAESHQERSTSIPAETDCPPSIRIDP